MVIDREKGRLVLLADLLKNTEDRRLALLEMEAAKDMPYRLDCQKATLLRAALNSSC
jgi:hypothetical protein